MNPSSTQTSRAEHDGRASALTGRRFGPYRLERRIGAGGMGRVYEARHRTSGARVALKMLLPELTDDPDLVTSFIDEARIAGELSHPNILPVYEFGQIDTTYYLTMPFIDGVDLRRLLLGLEGAPLPPEVAVFVAHQLALALDYLHHDDREIVHRDVTPDNVFITRAGGVLLGDFGVAKARARLTETQAGQIKGKLPYLAPEQVRGDPVTQRADVFGLGLLLYEMLTGERANPAQTERSALEWAMNPSVRPPSSLVPAAAPLDRVVQRALERHPTLRTRDAGLLVDQLQRELKKAPQAERALRELVRGVQGLAPSDHEEGLDDPTVVDSGASIGVQWDALYESPREWASSLRGDDLHDDGEPPTEVNEPPTQLDEPPTQLNAAPPPARIDDVGMPPTSLYPALIDT
jgi:serine/threonine protein kinase